MMKYAHLLVFVEGCGLCRQADGWHGLGEGDVLAQGDDGVVPVHCIVAEAGVPHKRCRDKAKIYKIIKYVALGISVKIVILFTFSVRCFGYNRTSRAQLETWQIKVIIFRYSVRHVIMNYRFVIYNAMGCITVPLTSACSTCQREKV